MKSIKRDVKLTLKSYSNFFEFDVCELSKFNLFQQFSDYKNVYFPCLI